MPFGPASLLGVERFSEESEAPLELIPGDEDARKEQIIRAVYKQVLGNAYVMDSERQIVEESQFKLGEISVRELVGGLPKATCTAAASLITARDTATSSWPSAIFSDAHLLTTRKCVSTPIAWTAKGMRLISTAS
tara:strand:+ start:308 stop:712 length:405 start_codon:yes stop_codon:yes gene_type:complete